MAKTTQLTVSAESKPGVLAKVCDAIAKAGVNILAVSAGDAAGRGKIRLITSDQTRAKAALLAAKIRCSEEPALLLTMDDRPGTLAAAASRLAAAKINIKCAYATAGVGGPARVVLVVANPEKAERALG